MGDSRKVLTGRLKSLKGWLTQTINSCENLMAMPHSVANESFLNIASGSEANMTTLCEMEFFDFLWLILVHYLPLPPT